ncbi:HNH endonuclease [Subtercola sp. YIM 133946]|uniref:HNH endonuclease n=1 Tax=Subtercola sp. YIM 133946 TaxID=3118909 RepID=UPI002F92D158
MTAPTPATRAALLERDGHRCIVCGAITRLEAQHRQAVGMGGSKRRPTLVELVAACTVHNNAFEAEMQEYAIEHGYKVRKWVKDCALVPVFYPRDLAWFRLEDNRRIQITVREAQQMFDEVYGKAA